MGFTDTSAIDAAGMVLAFGFGYGGAWITEHGTDDFGKPDKWQAGVYGSEATPAASATLHVARETETLELAKRAIPRDPKKQPDWFKRLPQCEQDRLSAWCDENPLTGGGPYRVREFEHWQTATTYTLVPRAPDGSDVAAALAMADLPGPLRPVLELAALERLAHVPTVLMYLRVCGVRDDIARLAINRWFWPDTCGFTMQTGAKALHMRKDTFCQLMRTAQSKLHKWHRDASVTFLAAYGNRKWRKKGVIVRGRDNDLPCMGLPTAPGNCVVRKAA